jgi:hypothetical protein
MLYLPRHQLSRLLGAELIIIDQLICWRTKCQKFKAILKASPVQAQSELFKPLTSSAITVIQIFSPKNNSTDWGILRLQSDIMIKTTKLMLGCVLYLKIR